MQFRDVNMVTSDPAEMVANLRSRAHDLAQRAQRLLDAAAVIEEDYGLSHGHQLEANFTSHIASSEQNTATTPLIAAPGERLKQLIQFLKDHGPKRRSEIAKDSGVPKGTISHLLKDNSHFKQLQDGRWDAKVQHDMS
ncbi:MAG: hypothetical protein H0U97_11440 [Gammaproteobacteria bacterium]|nr:hypothetical protein [Gammaproteobacteria bacterium]